MAGLPFFGLRARLVLLVLVARPGHPRSLDRPVQSALHAGVAGPRAARYGGEEFALILLDASAEDTEERAKLLREEAARLRVDHGHEPLGNVTISVGVAVFPDHGDAAETLLKAADAALYRVKAGGRDRVMVAEVVS